MTAVHMPGRLGDDEILAAYVELRAQPFWDDASPVEIADELGVTVRDVLRAEERYLRRRNAHRLIGFLEDIIARRGLDLTWYQFGITLAEDFDSRLASMPHRASEEDRWRAFMVALMAEKEAA